MKSSSVNLPSNVENISAGGKDLLKRLLNPNPRMRLKSILALQRIAFFMSCDIQSYTLKQVRNQFFKTNNFIISIYKSIFFQLFNYEK